MKRKKNVRSSVRICEPSTSASAMMMILPYRSFERSNSSPMPQPSAVTTGISFSLP